MVFKGQSHSAGLLAYRTPLHMYLLSRNNLAFLHDSKSPLWTHPSHELNLVAVRCPGLFALCRMAPHYCVLGDLHGFFLQCHSCIWTPETCPWTDPLPGVYRLQIQNFCFRQGEARNPDQNGWEGNWEEKNEDKETFLSCWTFCSVLILTVGKLEARHSWDLGFRS